jgi:hypothetical protein
VHSHSRPAGGHDLSSFGRCRRAPRERRSPLRQRSALRMRSAPAPARSSNSPSSRARFSESRDYELFASAASVVIAGALMAVVLREKHVLESKIAALGHGLFIPIFFVVVGIRFIA